MKKSRRILAFVLSMVMCLSLLPANITFAADNVSYVNASGVAQTPVSATDITSSTTTWSNGWYYASGNVTIGSRVTVSGTVNLILADGATLTASGGVAVNSGNTLIIWGQSGGTGKLVATGGENQAGIGGNYKTSAGTITINGGVINTTGGKRGAGIGGGGDGGYSNVTGGGAGTVTINGGNVTATGGSSGAGIGAYTDVWSGSIKITGGVIIASTLGGTSAGCGMASINVSGCPVILCSGYINGKSSGESWEHKWISGILFTDNGEWATGTVFGNPTLNQDVAIGTLGHEKNLKIPSGSTLTVPDGFTFSTGGGGTVTNEGTIVIAQGGTFSAAKLNNNAAIQNDGNLSMTASWDGDISVNKGTIANGETGIVNSRQKLTGTGSITTNGIKFDLDGVTASPNQRTLTHDNTAYSTTLTADEGNNLPGKIVVKIGGVEFTGHGYTTDNPVITIPADNIKGNIEIIAPVTHVMLNGSDISAYLKEQAGATLIVASYIGEKMHDIKLIPVSSGAYKESIENIGLDTSGADTVKAFLWYDMTNLTPLCEADEITLEN